MKNRFQAKTEVKPYQPVVLEATPVVDLKTTVEEAKKKTS
jgi:hypothetical protein